MTSRRRRNDAMSYVSERFGGLEGKVPRTMKDLLWSGLRLLKTETARYFEYRGQTMEAEATTMSGLSIEEQVEIMKEAKQWQALAGVIKATDVVIPQPSAEPDRTENPPRKRKVKVYVEEEDDDGQGGPQDG